MRDFSFEEICPFPFDRSINMISFPQNFEIPKFNKYTRQTCPVTHLNEFFALCQEVAYSEGYLKRLFTCILGSPALEWLMDLPKGSITSFNDLMRKFVAQHSYNIEHHASLSDLCNTKQRNGETFSIFLQRWRHLANHMPYKIEDSHLMDIFIKNLIAEMSFHMKMASLEDFSTLVKKGKNIENDLLDKGAIKHNSSSSSNNDTNNNRKPKFWSKNKGVMHDGVTNVKSIQNL